MTRASARAEAPPVGDRGIAIATGDGGLPVPSSRPRSRRLPAKVTRHLPVLLSVTLGLGIWQIVGSQTNNFVFASFSKTMVALWHLSRNGVLLHDTKISLVELGIGFGFAAVFGIVGGLAAGLWRIFRKMSDIWVTVSLAIPFVALFPILLVWFGLGVNSKIALAMFAGFPPIWLNTKAGVATVDNNLLEMTSVFGGSMSRRIRSVVLPWCLPSMVEGLRIGLGRAFLGVIIGELLASDGGLGYLIGLEGNTLRMDNLLAAVVVVAVITVVLSTTMRTIQYWLVPWWKERS